MQPRQFELGLFKSPPFDLNELSYNVFCRFIELLSSTLFPKFAGSSKANYVKCLQLRGIAIDVTKNAVWTGKSTAKYGPPTFAFRTRADFAAFEREYSKFLPFFRLSKLRIRFNQKDAKQGCGQGLDSEVIPVPRTFQKLQVEDLESCQQVDHVAAHYYHRDIGESFFFFQDMGLDAYIALVNRIFVRMPHIGMYFFTVPEDVDIDRVLPQLRIPEHSPSIVFPFVVGGVGKIHEKGVWKDLDMLNNSDRKLST